MERLIHKVYSVMIRSEKLMPLSIHDPEAERLASEVAIVTGESLAEVITSALREKLAREKCRAQDMDAVVRRAMAIGKHFSSLPVLDHRSADEILGYDARGLASC